MAGDWIPASTAARQVMKALPPEVPDAYRWIVARLCLCMAIERYWQTPPVRAFWTERAKPGGKNWRFHSRPRRENAWCAVTTGSVLNRYHDGQVGRVYLKVERASLRQLIRGLSGVIRPIWWEDQEGRDYLKELLSSVGTQVSVL